MLRKNAQIEKQYSSHSKQLFRINKLLVIIVFSAMLFVLATPVAYAANVVNIEFNFTPFTGDHLKSDKVERVAGKARILLNGIMITEQDITKDEILVLFEEREISPAIWITAKTSFGSLLRKGKNKLTIVFEPTDPAVAYQTQLRWAQVMDESTSEETYNGFKSTNMAGNGNDINKAKGKVTVEHEFNADFADDMPWHHYPAVTSLSDEDKKNLTLLLKERLNLFKPNFEGIYKILKATPGVQDGELRKAKVLDAAYAAGVKMTLVPDKDIDFVVSDTQEVVVRGKTAPLFHPVDMKAFDKIKGDDNQFAAVMALYITYPAQVIFAKNPAGKWEVIY